MKLIPAVPGILATDVQWHGLIWYIMKEYSRFANIVVRRKSKRVFKITPPKTNVTFSYFKGNIKIYKNEIKIFKEMIRVKLRLFYLSNASLILSKNFSWVLKTTTPVTWTCENHGKAQNSPSHAWSLPAMDHYVWYREHENVHNLNFENFDLIPYTLILEKYFKRKLFRVFCMCWCDWTFLFC